MSDPVVLSFGGGVNSTALLLGLLARNEPPDLVLFSDTGGEREGTYEHVREMSAMLEEHELPPITWVTNAGREGFPHRSLEDECYTNQTLPSLAFGNKGCSAKWKRQPMDRYLRTWLPAVTSWARGGKVVRLIGIDADESHRSANLMDLDDPRWIYRRPLVDWDWGRDECVAEIERSGVAAPTKSACWFCPAMKKGEVLRLAKEEPELYQRAVNMEHRAAPNLGTVRGLGRNWSWEELVRADRAQLRLFPEATEDACGCYDGSEE
jgi:hypothetical protein